MLNLNSLKGQELKKQPQGQKGIMVLAFVCLRWANYEYVMLVCPFFLC